MPQPLATSPRAAGNLRGAAYMLLVTASFTVGDALIRSAAEQMPLFQVVFLRGLVAMALLGGMAWRSGAFALRIAPRDRRLIGLRSGAEICAMIPFFIALANMPFANVSALLQALPLTLTLAGALFLGEPVGWRRLAAIGVGLVGVLCIVQPGGAGFSAYALLVLLAVGFVTFRDLSTRRIDPGIPAVFLGFVMAVFVTVAAGGLSLLTPWAPVTGAGGLLLVGAGVFIASGYTFAALAMRHGEIGFVTPFRYMALIWAVLIGFFVFGEWPDPLTWIGAGIVVATGLYTLYREQVVRRRRRAR
ncbi:DMT family transporter [Dinoroseobacter sp. S375]|uniref:DMT family transporter n=1 Tax=Dinoroseobacter sp. S375 TaxID=3415136 RepID=UPI003C7CB209